MILPDKLFGSKTEVGALDKATPARPSISDSGSRKTVVREKRPHCPTRSELLKAALSYAKRGHRIFPCRPAPYKSPLTRHGFKDATTDRDRVTGFWNAHTEASIGIPTGERFWVLDVDDLAALEKLPGELPDTWAVRTPRGGFHFYFRTVEGITNRPGGLPAGIDVRGTGGYVLVPPSDGYTVENRAPMTEAPAWLLDLLKKPESDPPGQTMPRTGPVDANVDGAPILDGTRDNTMFRIACSYRGRGMDEGELLDTLRETNARRCQPPLEEWEVEKLARQAARYTPGSTSGPPDTETLETLAELERCVLWGREWPGMGGKSERDAYAALIVAAQQHGSMTPTGVRVPLSVRELALDAATSKRAMFDSWKKGERKPGIVSRLKRAGLIRSDNADRRLDVRGAFILVLPNEARAEFHHSTTGEVDREQKEGNGETLRAPRLRWSAPEIRRLGKTCGAILDALEAAGGELELEDLATAVRITRPRDLRRRHVARLEAAAVVECSDNTVRLGADWLDALHQEREFAGEIAAEERDRQDYKDELEAFRNRHKIRPERAPSRSDMDRHRESGPDRRRGAIESALVRLFRDRPEYRGRRIGQITCAVIAGGYIGPDFPRGVDPGGPPTDHEVATILQENGVEVAA